MNAINCKRQRQLSVLYSIGQQRHANTDNFSTSQSVRNCTILKIKFDKWNSPVDETHLRYMQRFSAGFYCLVNATPVGVKRIHFQSGRLELVVNFFLPVLDVIDSLIY